MLIGGAIPVTENFAIPASLAVIANYADKPFGDYSYNNRYGFLVNGGLIIHGKYGVLAGYAGYSFEWFNESYPAYDIKNELFEEKVQWAVYPLINAKEYPFLKMFLKRIDGYYSMDNLSMDRDEFKPNYEANVVFRNITINQSYKNSWKMSFSTYTHKNWFDYMAKYNLYAGRLDFITSYNRMSDHFVFSFEGGYREFFDIMLTNNVYENGAYIKIATKLVLDDFDRSGGMIYLESGSMSVLKNYILGILFTLPLDAHMNIIAVFGRNKAMDIGAKIHEYSDYYLF